ncbi:hypothetical protein BGM19_38620 [Streptomyces agglomeratus]|uniref:type I-E CRISPR-associated protein Cse2/CasB n=1 Tax=Streptomyces agglomeratus TaxID=285458 RepID=UPI0008544E60|nr:type I-E CRISPR-associated protein Cse2/CasB [Streptomyces agglomeratus]OEJ36413.1 hypothetical protein BGK72_37440 [Streptomyces agglomeratus]OEJ56566.1 hypothetical protein BGM19_38620 [Streptomyces agglomeratus]
MSIETSSLAHQPWVQVRDLSGQRSVVSGCTALEKADNFVLDAADPLEHAAIVRFLVAVICAAGLSPASENEYGHRCADASSMDWGKAAQWLGDHAGDVDLLDPQRPLFQDATLHEVPRPRALPARYLDLTAAGAMGRPLLADHRHLHAELPALSPARAAVLLLTQQMWAVGGRLRCSDAVYGPGSNYSSAAAACGKLIWLAQGTLATVLSWRTVPTPSPGIANWTYRARGSPGQRDEPTGELDALTWMPRRVLFTSDSDGLIDRAHFTQGWHRAAAMPGRPGSADLLFTDSGKPLPCTALKTPDDLVPAVERWWQAGEGSLPAHIRTATRLTGCPPPAMRVIGIATDRKKLLHIRDVTVPPDMLTDESAEDAARYLGTLRRKTDGRPLALTDLSGTILLTDPAFRHADERDRAHRAARAHHVLAPTLRDTAVERSRLYRVLTACAKEKDPSMTSLFVTAQTNAPSVTTFGEQMERRLHGIRASEDNRELLGQMRLWTSSLNTHNQASEAVTRDLPANYRDAALLTAALYAAHAQLHPQPFGRTPLPRLMRAFGNGQRYGPRHAPTETLMKHLLATTRPRLLLPTLTQLVRYAAAHEMTPSWSALAEDLAAWNTATRNQWAAMFYTSQPLNELNQIGTHA